MLAVVGLLVLAGSIPGPLAAQTDQSRTIISRRPERGTESLKYLLDINRQKYLPKFQESRPDILDSQTPKPAQTQSNIRGGILHSLHRQRSEYKERLNKYLAARKGSTRLTKTRSKGTSPGGTREFRGYSRQSSRNDLRRNNYYKGSSGGECEALRTENEMLKQLLERKESGRAGDSKGDVLKGLLNLVNKETESKSQLPGIFSLVDLNKQDQANQQINVLDRFKGAEFTQNPALQFQPQPQIEETLIEPITSTVLHTKVYDTTLTEELTGEIEILFKGKKITTQIINHQTKVVPTSEIVTQTIEITPSPTFITPTPILDLLNKPKPTFAPLNLINLQKITPTLSPSITGNLIKSRGERTGELDSFQSLQQILKKIRERKQKARLSALKSADEATLPITSSASTITLNPIVRETTTSTSSSSFFLLHPDLQRPSSYSSSAVPHPDLQPSSPFPALSSSLDSSSDDRDIPSFFIIEKTTKTKLVVGTSGAEPSLAAVQPTSSVVVHVMSSVQVVEHPAGQTKPREEGSNTPSIVVHVASSVSSSEETADHPGEQVQPIFPSTSPDTSSPSRSVIVNIVTAVSSSQQNPLDSENDERSNKDDSNIAAQNLDEITPGTPQPVKKLSENIEGVVTSPVRESVTDTTVEMIVADKLEVKSESVTLEQLTLAKEMGAAGFFTSNVPPSSVLSSAVTEEVRTAGADIVTVSKASADIVAVSEASGESATVFTTSIEAAIVPPSASVEAAAIPSEIAGTQTSPESLERRTIAPVFVPSAELSEPSGEVAEVRTILAEIHSISLENIKQLIDTQEDQEEQGTESSPDSLNQQSSVITIYVSGSKPGEFTTSLKTVEGSEGRRRKRGILPSRASKFYIDQTKPPNLYTFQDELQSGSKDTLLGSFCEPVTVTITETVTLC